MWQSLAISHLRSWIESFRGSFPEVSPLPYLRKSFRSCNAEEPKPPDLAPGWKDTSGPILQLSIDPGFAISVLEATIGSIDIQRVRSSKVQRGTRKGLP